MTGEAVAHRKVAVIGAGSWGTAIAHLLRRNGHEVSLWSHEEEVVRAIRTTGTNAVYLPGIPMPEGILVSTALEEVLRGAQLVVSASPSQFVAGVMEVAAPHLLEEAIVVSASKGIETTSLRRMDEVLNDVLPLPNRSRLVVLSGPSFALEVARGMPTVVVAASRDREAAGVVQRTFGARDFRVYTHTDVVGVELGGAIKNVVAIAAGVVVGLGLGQNTLAALITRGLAEMTRLGVALGAEAVTFSGLAGLGDLVLTCTGGLSRNRGVGVRLGQGESLDEILGEMRAVAEGVRTTVAVRDLALRHGVEMPIVEQVYAILHGTRSPRVAVDELMMREPRGEQEVAGRGGDS